MEINEVFKIIEKQLENTNTELGFKKQSEEENCITFSGEKGAYKVAYDRDNGIMSFECEDEKNQGEFNTISKSLFDTQSYDERDAKSLANEIEDEIKSLYNARKKVDIDKIKMPKAVSRTKAKNGVISYDSDSLANRFGVMFPEAKDDIKENIAKYGEFLPETFFTEIGTKKVIDIIARGNDAECKKLFKMLNEIYEDGTNEVQDIIGVTILGAMKNDKELLATADKYMSEYMSGPVHEINKLLRKENKFTKQLKNPPAYKPKKKNNALQNALQSQGR